ncbi:MAG TPA: alanine racemase [Gemmatimonadaceae bacterium]|jgi:D-serine deaminase-like pyridoxal phosphate-dependent protein
MPLTIADLETPVPIVDLDRLARNLDRAAAYATAHHLALRPHIKTHKSLRIAGEQLRHGAIGLTCATPFEAEVMSNVCDDILVAYPPVGRARANRLASLPETVKLTVALDSIEAIDTIADAARDADRAIGIYVELDLGMHRVGLPRVADAIALAQSVVERGPLVFEGIAFYPGHVREPVGQQAARLEELSASVRAAVDAFDRAGLAPPVVSGGSTPTLWSTHEISGVTEFRPGTYVYNDRTTAAVGACQWDDCAFTVLATVVSTAVPGQAVIDAGSKALGREPMRGSDADGFGCLLGKPDVIVKSMSEEHGILDLSNTSWRPEVGEQVRVIPNHVCIVVHLNDVIAGVRGDVVETTWDVDARSRGYSVMAPAAP